MKKVTLQFFVTAFIFLIGTAVLAVDNLPAVTDATASAPSTPKPEEAPAPVATNEAFLHEYLVQPGDILSISVWKEPDMQTEVLIRPDGGMTFPLAGEIYTAGKTISEIEKELKKKLSTYISNPILTITPRELRGNRIYVIGKVAKPGVYLISSYIDILQALSMAGGMTPFAAVNDIIVIRRQDDGKQKTIHFRYADIEDGDDLSQNVVLQSGDTIVVP